MRNHAFIVWCILCMRMHIFMFCSGFQRNSYVNVNNLYIIVILSIKLLIQMMDHIVDIFSTKKVKVYLVEGFMAFLNS